MAEDAAAAAAGAGVGGEKRRRNRGGKGRGRGPKGPNPRETAVAVPKEFAGQNKNGVICEIIKKDKNRFGFIYIGDGADLGAESPRIYFNFSESGEWKEEAFVPRRGYQVAFQCGLDAQERAFASNIVLTEAGKTTAAEREEAIKAGGGRAAGGAKPAAKAAAPKKEKAAAAAAGAEDKPKEPRVRQRRARNPENDRKINLKVTCKGKEGEQTIEVNLSETIGKLKHSATRAFECPVEFTVYHKGAFLTKEAYLALQDGDSVELAEPTA